MIEVLYAFFPSLILGWLILHFRDFHESLTADSVTNGPQKIHSKPVPRIGGLMIFVGFVFGVAAAAAYDHLTWGQFAFVVLCALPAFAGGFYEDVTKRGSVLLRLSLTFLSAALAFWLLNARLDRLDFALADGLLTLLPVSLLFTMFAAGGVSQSMNIIDGLNGLAVFIGLSILLAFGAVAYQLGDSLVLSICVATVGGMAGFFFWNFPKGKIFCGDGGAYFIGFVIAEVSVLLVHRHREVSAWFPLVVAIYPIWETVFSILRRRFISGRSATQPDALHLHSLVYRWIVKQSASNPGNSWESNAISSVLCWLFPLSTTILGVCFWNDTHTLVKIAGCTIAVYLVAYMVLASKKNWRKRPCRQLERAKKAANLNQAHEVDRSSANG